MEIPPLKRKCYILCVKVMPTNPTQENWPGTSYMVKASQVIVTSFTGWSGISVHLGLQVKMNWPESISNEGEILVGRFSYAWFPSLGTGKKKNAFKLLDIVLLNEITQQKLIIWPLLLLSTKCSRRHLWLLKPPTELGKQSSQNIMKPAFADVWSK